MASKTRIPRQTGLVCTELLQGRSALRTPRSDWTWRGPRTEESATGSDRTGLCEVSRHNRSSHGSTSSPQSPSWRIAELFSWVSRRRLRGATVPARRHALDLRPAARASRPHHSAASPSNAFGDRASPGPGISGSGASVSAIDPGEAEQTCPTASRSFTAPAAPRRWRRRCELFWRQ